MVGIGEAAAIFQNQAADEFSFVLLFQSSSISIWAGKAGSKLTLEFKGLVVEDLLEEGANPEPLLICYLFIRVFIHCAETCCFAILYII